MDLHLVSLSLSISAANNVDTSYVDVKTAFQGVKLDKEIGLSLPVTLRSDTATRKIVVMIYASAGDIVQLRRNLYGLKQADLN